MPKSYQIHLIGLIALGIAYCIPRARHVLFSVWKKICARAVFRYNLVGLACLLSIFMGITRMLALHYGAFDHGIFTQVLYSLSHGHGFHYTLEGERDYLQTHFSPIFLLLAPFFKAFGSSVFFLNVINPLFIWGGIVAWMKIAETENPKHEELATCIALFAVFFDSFWVNVRWGFHEIEIYFFALSWFFYFWKIENRIGALMMGILCCLTKETAWLDFGLVSFILSFQTRSHANFYRAFGLGAVLAFVMILTLRPTQQGEQNWLVFLYGYLGGNTVSEIGMQVLSHPLASIAKVQEQVGWDKIAMFVGCCFLFFAFAARGPLLFAILPALLLYSFAKKITFREFNYHYALNLWPVLFFSSLPILQRSSRYRMIWVLIPFAYTWFDPVKFSFEEQAHASARTELRKALDQIPKAQSVWSDENIAGYLAARPILFIPDTKPAGLPCPDVIITAHPENFSNCADARMIHHQDEFEIRQK